MKRPQEQLELPVGKRNGDCGKVKAEVSHSTFNLHICVWYAAALKLKGAPIKNPRGFGKYLCRTGDKDEQIAIEIALNPEYWPIILRLLSLDSRMSDSRF